MLELIEGLAVFNVELFLVLASLGLLLVGAFQKNDNVVLYLSVAAIGFACFLNFVHFSDQMYAFSNMLESNFFIQFGKMLILISSLFVLLIATNETQKFELPILVLLSTSGMLILTSAYNFITLYLGLELMSLPLYILAAFNRNDSRSTEAGLKYFILGAIASGVFLMGTSLIYGFTGAINFGNVYDYYLNLTEGESVSMPLGFLVGMVFVVTAFCFKISAVPFHMWTPDVYQGSPTLITMFFASAPKVAGFIILIKILTNPFADLYVQWQQVVLFASIASMLVGSLGAIMQVNFKRLLAYSSIGHVGFALGGLATAEPYGVQGILIYLAIYITMTIGTFGAIIMLKKGEKNIVNIEDFAGLSKSCPNIAICITIFMMSMAGIPPLAGFFAKYFILVPLMKAEMYATAVIFVIASVISAFYYLNIVKVIYFDAEDKKASVHANLAFKFVVLICVLFNIVFLTMPSYLVNITQIASMSLVHEDSKADVTQ